MATDLQDAIIAGINQLGELPEFAEEEKAPITPTKETKAVEPSAETGGEEEDEDEVIQEQDLDADTIEKAKALYKALDNPNTASAALDFLYKTLGVTPPTEIPENKAEIREQVKDIVEQMKEAAPNLDFLIDKIGPIIKNELEKVRQEVKQEVESDRIERQNNELKRETSLAFTNLAKTMGYENNVIPDKILNEMTSLMKDILPSENLTPDKYIKILHDASPSARAAHAAKNTSNGNGNSRKPVSPASRLASERVAPTVDRSLPKKLSLKDSIRAAVDQLSQGG